MTDLKTDFAAGDVLPAVDVNATNAKVNQNSSDISDNVTALAGKSPSDHSHDLVDLDDIDFSAVGVGKMLAKKDGDGFEFIDPPEGGGGGALEYVAISANQVAEAGKFYFADDQSVLTPPSNPTVGDRFALMSSMGHLASGQGGINFTGLSFIGEDSTDSAVIGSASSYGYLEVQYIGSDTWIAISQTKTWIQIAGGPV